jgi:hypothetical protein
VRIAVPLLADLTATNAFLRALWATLRGRYGKCAWHSSPSKDGGQKRIYLGQMDLGMGKPIHVSLVYETRSTLREVQFGEMFDDPVDANTELGNSLSESVTEALSRHTAPDTFSFRISVSSLRVPMAPYAGPRVKIHPTGGNNTDITIAALGFDEADARSEFLRILTYVLDTLSVETNQLFWIDAMQSERELVEGSEFDLKNIPPDNTFTADGEWIDGYPVERGCLLLSRSGLRAIEAFITNSDLGAKETMLARAFHHFHVAREQDALVNDRLRMLPTRTEGDDVVVSFQLDDDPIIKAAAKFSRRAEELAAVLYLSAVEVASAIDAPPAQSCRQCGQLQYRISARVADYIGRHTPEAGRESMRRVFKRHYASRSQYLHAGAVLVDHTYTGTNIPRLDPSTESGAAEYSVVRLLNLREWVGYSLRNQLRQTIG